MSSMADTPPASPQPHRKAVGEAKHAGVGGLSRYKRTLTGRPKHTTAEKADRALVEAGYLLAQMDVGDASAAADKAARQAVAEAQGRYTTLGLKGKDGQNALMKEWYSVLHMSVRQIKAVARAGEQRIRAVLDGTAGTKKVGGRSDKAKHTEDELNYVAELVKGPDGLGSFTLAGHTLEPGLPCTHKPLQVYLPEGTNFLIVHKSYVELLAKEHGGRLKPVKYKQFLAMRKKFWPQVKQCRREEDVCDGCFRIETLLLDKTLTDSEREALKLQKTGHLKDARDQRRIVSALTETLYAQHTGGGAAVKPITLDLTLDDPEVAIQQPSQTVEMSATAQDFGGSFPIPWYGKTRPGSDFYLSNFNVNNFVISDLETGKQYIYIYTEEYGGKGADAVCSMRLLHLLNERKRIQQEGLAMRNTTFKVMDNCVGQNKSQATMMYECIMSLILDQKAIINYMISGHSHMKPDLTVAHMKRTMKNKNLYSVEQIIECISTQKSLHPIDMTPRAGFSPFREGWADWMKKYCKKLPSGFTKSFFFEIHNGVIRYKHVCSSDDDTFQVHVMIRSENLVAVRKAALMDLFGSENPDEMALKNLRLAVQVPKVLTEKKITSLRKKLPGIPKEFHVSYPRSAVELGALDYDPDDPDGKAKSLAKSLEAEQEKSKQKILGGKKKVGRPSKKSKLTQQEATAANQPSLLSFWAVTKTATRAPKAPTIAHTVAVPVSKGTAAKKPLADRWKEAVCPTSKKTYYWHTVSQEVRWDRPTK